MTPYPIEHDPIFGCQLWIGSTDKDGYGRIGIKLAHRVLWEEQCGPIPKGKEIEHRCRRRNCVAIKHLAVFSRSEQENAKRWRRRARRKCPNGCDMGITGMVTPEGGRLCRQCEK